MLYRYIVKTEREIMLQVVACGCVLVTMNCKKSVIAPLLAQHIIGYKISAYIVIVLKSVSKKAVKSHFKILLSVV